MRRWAWILLLLPTPARALNLTGFWATDSVKMARQDFYPGGSSSNTITRFWDGRTIAPTSGKGETVGIGLYLLNNSGSNATQVNVAVSSFTGSNGGSIIPVSRLISGVTNFTSPVDVFVSTYVQMVGMTKQSWELEYEERDIPPAWRVSCTTNGNNDCIPDGGQTFLNRQDHFKYYPDALIPAEAYASSSFTVAASSSQLVWMDIYVGTDAVAGTYNGLVTITEGVSVSTRIPISILVYNFSLPTQPSYNVIGYYSAYDINYRHQGNHTCSTIACQTTQQNYAKLLHRHKIIPIGEDDSAADVAPSVAYPRLTGNLYSPTSGYYTGPGLSVADSVYSVGTYANWQSAWSTTNDTSFCTHVSNWETYFKNNFSSVRSFLYLSDEVGDLTNTEKWATWMSTVTGCQVASYTLHRWTTATWPSTYASAKHVDMPASTTWITYSSTSWRTAADYYIAGDSQPWAYNGHPSWSGSNFATEDSGVSPFEQFWADWKKGVKGHFLWQTTYFTDVNNGGSNGATNDNPLWTQARTFGYSGSYDTLIGTTGFNYSQGDGLLIYPGHDTVFPAYDYSMDGGIPSFRLKMVRRGIQDVDYLNQAYAVNPSSTVAIVSNMIGNALWERVCFTSADCTYAYGGREWVETSDTWNREREALAQIIVSGNVTKGVRGSTTFRGSGKLR